MNKTHFFLMMLSTALIIIFLQVFERDIVSNDCVICVLFLHNVEL